MSGVEWPEFLQTQQSSPAPARNKGSFTCPAMFSEREKLSKLDYIWAEQTNKWKLEKPFPDIFHVGAMQIVQFMTNIT